MKGAPIIKPVTMASHAHEKLIFYFIFKCNDYLVDFVRRTCFQTSHKSHAERDRI